MMNVLKLFQSRSKFFYFFLLLSGLVSSLANIGIMMFVSSTLSGAPIPFFRVPSYLLFISLFLISFLVSSFFQSYLVIVTNNILYDMELSIISKVRDSTLESFEALGSEKIYGAINDARVFSRIPEIFVNIINSLITVFCALLYLFYSSWLGGISVLLLMAILLIIYFARNKKIEKSLHKVRELQDEYYESLRELIDGFRQIRISRLRNENLYNKHILKNRSETRFLSILTSKKYVSNELTGMYSWYIVLGVVIFLLPALANVDKTLLVTYVTTILFMIGPVSQLIVFFPFYSALRVAVDRIMKVDKQLERFSLRQSMTIPDEEFVSMRFENMTYRYNSDDSNTPSFEMPPFSLEILKGQVLFIVGGNGSGKSTFINLLTGLYKPTGGRIFINEKEMDWYDFAFYANNMTAVYTNHYLFKNNYDEHDLSDNNTNLQMLRNMLNLDDVLKVDMKKNTVDTRLSKGQQKRAALLLGLLENKPILILDEWAAEQDPQNRKNFYTKWIEKMRKMGKTIIIVSHDDEFYHKADRIIKFNYGKIVSDTYQAQETVCKE